MAIKVPKVGKKTVPPKEIEKYEERGWKFHREISRTAWEITKHYEKWEKFEIKMRKLFKELQFEDCILDPEEFFYKELGPQIDVCGGVGKTFLVVDCTSTKEPAYRELKEKIKDNYSKMKTVKDKIKARYGNKYSNVVFTICTQDIQVKDKDQKYAAQKSVIIIDSLFFERCIKYLSAFGPSLKSHILKRLGGKFEFIEDGDPTEPYRYPCVKVKSGEKNLYSFTIEPETLLKLAYVYRLEEWMEDEKGYQRDLSIPKLSNINEFLSNPDNYFANNVICCFGTVVEKQKFSKSKKKVTFVPEKSMKPSENLEIKFGTIYIPKLYCSVEIIDGQHRLYGYYDVSEEKAYEQRLSRRRASDALSVVAIEDPGENERPILFVDINSTQTKVRAANLWSLMRRIRPDTLMGYISNIVVALNEKGPFKDLIYIPGVNTTTGRPLNLANIGKGIKDRKLVYKGDTRDWHQWDLFDQDRHMEKYPKTVTKNRLST